MIEENVFVALGSNLGDRRSNLDRAIEVIGRLPGTGVSCVSGYMWTPPWGFREQPWFLNAVARVSTGMGPAGFLKALLSIESDAGRVRSLKNGPRTLDLDLLLYGSLTIEEPGLIVPHPRMCERHFVLAPMAQIAPDFVHPARRATVASLLADLGPQQVGPAVEEAVIAGS